MAVLVADQRYAALAPFQASNLVGPEDPVIIRLASGGFVAAWENNHNFFAQLFDRHGVPVGGNFTLQSLASFGHFDVSLAPLPSGGFVASWQSIFMDGTRVEIRLFDANGTPLGPETVLNAASNAQPNIAPLTSGGVVVTYTGNDGDGEEASGIKAQQLDGSGAKVGGEIFVNTSISGQQYYPLTTGLPGGGFVVIWTDFVTVRGQIFDAFGQKVGGQLDLAPNTGWAPSLATLANGNFILTYTLGDDLKAKIFSPTGALAVAEFSVATSAAGIQYMSSVAPFPGGEFVVTWRDAAGTGNYVDEGEIRGQLFTIGGNKIGDEYLVNVVTAQGQSEPVSTVFGSRDVATLWIDYSSGFPPKAEIRLFFSTLFGTAGDDAMSGTSDRDFIFALDGSDSVIGGAAADELSGGDGDDFLLGGTGDDMLDGGAGNDLIRGEDGNDQLLGGDGNDNLRGGRGVDSFDGGDNDEVLNLISTYGDRISFFEQAATQGAVADLRTGVISNDGFGNAETMVGVESLGGDTAFTDTFYGNDNSNALLGSRGDNLYGFGGEDVVYVNAAPAVADGGAGDDVLVLQSAGGWLVPDVNSDGLAELEAAMTTGWFVDLANHQIYDGYGNAGTVQGFEAVIGSDLEDVLYGDSGANVLNGGGGDDFILGQAGDDDLSGGDGNDLLRGGSGVDHFDGGADDGVAALDNEIGDRVSFSDIRATQGAVADLRTGIISNDGFGNAETMTGIESLGSHTAYADTFYGNDSANFLFAGGGDILYGFGGDDLIQLTAAAAVIDGGSGVDLLQVSTNFFNYQPDTNGDGEAEIRPAMTGGYVVDLTGGTILDGYGNVGTVANVENLIGSEAGDELRGSAVANVLAGGFGNDFLLLQDGGDDIALGNDGNDVIYFGTAVSAGDVADGGAGRDAVVLQGNVNVTFSDTNLVGIESISIQSGANTRFGDTADNFYDFNVTTADGNLLAGQQLIVNGQSLRAGEDFTFDGSAETDGRFLVYGGHGVDDLTGGAGVDVFFFEGQRWGATDKVDGGGGRDSLVISAGSGLTHIEFAADAFLNIESISLNNRFATDPSQKPSYEIVLDNGNVAAGGTLIVNGSSIATAAQFVNVNGGAIQNGNLILYGGAGNDELIGGAGDDILYGAGGADELTGGSGADRYQYHAISDSLPGAADLIHFVGGVALIDVSRIDSSTLRDGNQTFQWIGSNPFSPTSDPILYSGQLRAVQSNGIWFVEGDVNADGVADFALEVMMAPSPFPLGSHNFIL